MHRVLYGNLRDDLRHSIDLEMLIYRPSSMHTVIRYNGSCIVLMTFKFHRQKYRFGHADIRIGHLPCTELSDIMGVACLSLPSIIRSWCLQEENLTLK